MGDIREGMRNTDAAHERRHTRAPSANWRISMCPTTSGAETDGWAETDGLARRSPLF